MAKTPTKPLTDRQMRFVQEYLVDLNAKQAAIRAGYSPKSAVYSGKRNMQRQDIQAAIQAEMKKSGDRCNVSADRVVLELARLAFYDPSNIVKVVGKCITITPTVKLDEDDRRAVSELAESKHGLRIKLADKIRALELLGKHLGMFVERHEHSGPAGGPIPLSDLSDEELAKIAAGSGQ